MSVCEPDIDDLNPPVFERTVSDVQMELLAATNEIFQLEARLSFLRSRERDLDDELRSLQTCITKRSQRNVDTERNYKNEFVMRETLGDIIDV
jgi:chromosome segregation ATPase